MHEGSGFWLLAAAKAYSGSKVHRLIKRRKMSEVRQKMRVTSSIQQTAINLER
jgi:hypothetical protein